MLKGNAIVGQSGGPTTVINASLAGVIKGAFAANEIETIYGAEHGIEGVLAENLVNLNERFADPKMLNLLIHTPAAYLGSCRYKLPKEFDEKYDKIFEVFKKHNIAYFFYIGGNDSSDTVRIVSEEARKENYDLRAVHIPKTIDNDLMMNDHTPGYPSAAKFVAQSFIGLNLDNRALPGVHIGVVMGRNAGFLTAASSIAQKYPDDGPHLIYLPEREFSIDKFLVDVKDVYDRYGRCMVAISEGIKGENGEPIIANYLKGSADAHGNQQLSGTGMLGDLLSEQIKAKLGIQRVRSDTLGYLQRSFFGCVSNIDQLEAREVGEKAAQFAIWHNIDGSITINRTGFYSVDYKMTDLNNVAANTRLMPDEFINKEGNNVTEAFKYYLQPLLGENMPQASMLRAPRAKKILNPVE